MSFKSIIDSPDYTIDNLLKLAMFERAGDDLIAFSTAGRSRIMVAGATEDIWTGGGIRTVMEIADNIEVTSDSADDDSAGIGARAVFVSGLDENWDIQTEILSMDGLATVTTANKYRRVVRSVVVASGSNHKNVGNISLKEATGSTLQTHIAAGAGVAQQILITVPSGYNALLIKSVHNVFRGSGSGTRAAVLETKVRINDITGTSYTEISAGHHGLTDAGTSFTTESFNMSQGIGERTDFSLIATPEKNDTVVGGIISLLLIKEEFQTITTGF